MGISGIRIFSCRSIKDLTTASIASIITRRHNNSRGTCVLHHFIEDELKSCSAASGGITCCCQLQSVTCAIHMMSAQSGPHKRNTTAIQQKFLYCSCIVVVLHLCGPLKATWHKAAHKMRKPRQTSLVALRWLDICICRTQFAHWTHKVYCSFHCQPYSWFTTIHQETVGQFDTDGKCSTCTLYKTHAKKHQVL